MKNFIISSFLILLSLTSKSQCMNIESILVDACTNGGVCTPSLGLYCGCEGAQEMVRLKIGNLPINTANITFNWPSNPWQGISPITATTTAITNSLQSTILGCGVLLQPIAGVLPANSRVLFILNTNFCVGPNSFANLNDTFYLIFQNPNNTGGHFANANNGTNTVPRLTSFTVTGVPSCTQTVSYTPALLTSTAGVSYSVSGAYSSAKYDGGAVEYDVFGNATYVNRKCQAPFQPLSVDAGPDQTICLGSNAVLTATALGGYTSVLWSLGSGATGSFSPTNSLTTTYTPGVGDNGNTIKLYCKLTKACNSQTLTVKDSVNITNLQIPSTPVISSTNGYSLCPLASTILSYSISNASATGTMSTSWSSPAASTSTYAVSAPSGTVPVTYTLSLTNFCGVTTKTVNVYPLASPSVTISAPTLTACAGNTVAVMATSNSGNFSWNNPSGATTASVVLTANTTTTGVVAPDGLFQLKFPELLVAITATVLPAQAVSVGALIVILGLAKGYTLTVLVVTPQKFVRLNV